MIANGSVSATITTLPGKLCMKATRLVPGSIKSTCWTDEH